MTEDTKHITEEEHACYYCGCELIGEPSLYETLDREELAALSCEQCLVRW